MGFNPQFLSDLCITCTEDSLHCEVTNNKSPLYVYEKDYTFLILPVNIIATPEEIITAIKKLADADLIVINIRKSILYRLPFLVEEMMQKEKINRTEEQIEDIKNSLYLMVLKICRIFQRL